MKIKFFNKGVNLIAVLEDEIDHHWADYIKGKIDSELIRSSNRNLIFDFSKVSFMDSAGIGIIMGRYKNVNALKGKTAIINAGPRLNKIMEISGILGYVKSYESLDEALKKIEE